MSRKKRTKPYWEMNAAELADATKEFDKPLPASRFKPLSKSERERFERARKAGGSDIKRLLAFDVDEKLLMEATVFARRKNLSLMQVVERGLRRELAVKD